MVIQYLVCREQRHFSFCCEMMEPRQSALVVAAIDEACRQPHAIGVAAPEAAEDLEGLLVVKAMRQRQDQKLAFGKIQEVGELEVTLALFGILAALAAGKQLAQPAVSGTVARIDENIRRTVHKNDARTDQQLWLMRDFRVIELLVGAHHAGQRVVIGDADDGKPQFAGLMHIGARIRSAAQEREIRGDADLGIIGRFLEAGHTNSPCTNQLAGTGSPSPSTSSRP